MPHIDQIVLTALAVALLAAPTLAWRRGARGGHLLAAGFALFYGATLVVMLGAHCADVLYNAALGSRSVMGAGAFGVNWRTYSLLLFGVLLIRFGVACVRGGLALAGGDRGARRDVLRAAATVLLLVAPLVGVHAFFGWLISGATALTLAAVAFGTRERDAAVAAASDPLPTPAA